MDGFTLQPVSLLEDYKDINSNMSCRFLWFFYFIPYCLSGQSLSDAYTTVRTGLTRNNTIPISLSHLNHPINFDGYIGEGEWNDIDTLPLISHWPTFSNKPNGRTLFRVAYDDKFIYFSAFCYATPSHTQGPTFERDSWTLTMDQIAIVLDTYNDNENGVFFVVTPTGSRIDASIRNDAQSSSSSSGSIDTSWNSFWEARVSQDEKGWAVEARIPFTSLRFQPKNENVTMGIIAYRYFAMEKQMDIFPTIPPEWGFFSFVKPSQALDVSFSKNESNRPWFTSPYILAAAGHHHNELNEKVNDNRITAGLDVQHALTDNMNMDLTLNTDFAQVEADNRVVNLSRFSIFFPEKRRFFLERSSIMDFGFENNNRLFYSRRIGINDGKIIPLWGGGRIVGRLGNYDVGIMSMQSQKKDDLPSENFGVVRLRRKIGKNNSYIGGILTTRTDWKENKNIAYGIDGIIKLFGSDYLKINLANTYNSSDTLVYDNFLSDRKRIYIMWEKRSQVGFNYSLSYSQVDNQYSPGLGFEARNDFKAVGNRASYGWFPKNKSLRYISFNVNATAYFSNTSGNTESLLTAPSFYAEWNKNSSVTLTFNRFYDNVYAAFNLSDAVTIGAGKYINYDITLNAQTPSVNFINTSVYSTIGTFYGGNRITAGFSPSYTVSKFVTLSGFYEYNHVSFQNAPTYIAHMGRLKLSTSLNVKLSVNAFLQINSLTHQSAINFRFRYNSKDGNDFYLVYNETLNNQNRTNPKLQFSDYRAVILKYIYTFHLAK